MGSLALMQFFLILCQKFFCGGRFIFGPDAASLLLSVVLIGGPAIAFCVKVYTQIEHMDNVHQCNWYPVLVLGVLLTILVSIFVSCLTSSVRNVLTIANPDLKWAGGGVSEKTCRWLDIRDFLKMGLTCIRI